MYTCVCLRACVRATDSCLVEIWANQDFSQQYKDYIF
jgi:hypothetical protein